MNKRLKCAQCILRKKACSMSSFCDDYQRYKYAKETHGRTVDLEHFYRKWQRVQKSTIDLIVETSADESDEASDY